MERIASAAHHWRFCRLGGFDQVRLETAGDIQHLADLDQKLWAALSCPVNGLEFDARTLAMLDSDSDGRVRVQEVLAAVDWTCSVLNNLDTLLASAVELPLNAIDDSHPEGQQLLASARQLLTYLGKPEAESVSMEDVADTAALLHESAFNGDGIIPVHAAEDEETRKLIEEIIACMGSDEDRSGLPGISRERADAFFAAARLYSQWWEQANGNPAILPFGEATIAAASVFTALKNKVDDFFTRCGLAAFDPKAEEALNPTTATYETIARQDLHEATAELERFPLARIQAGRSLPLQEGINPAWAGAMEQFAGLIARPLFGPVEHLEESQWLQIKTTFVDHETWCAEKAGAEVESLGLKRVQAILQSSGQERLAGLIEQDLQLADQVETIVKVVRLVHFNRDLYRLLNNFVAFRDFYAQGCKAIFQAGTLFIDGRACELCVRVESVEAHSPLASLSRTCLAYCDCKRSNSGERMLIAAAFTGGDSDNLMLGRNGVFYDNKENDWDATIVKIIDHPISVFQAFWAPYKRIARMIGQQIEKFTAAKDKAVDSGAAAGIAGVDAKAAAGGSLRRRQVCRYFRRHQPCSGRHRYGHRLDPRQIYGHAPLGDSSGHRRHHSSHLRAVNADRLSQTAAAQSRADPGCQRLGCQHQGRHQYPLWFNPDQDGRVAQGSRAKSDRSFRREKDTLETLGFLAGTAHRSWLCLEQGIHSADRTSVQAPADPPDEQGSGKGSRAGKG